MEVKYVSKLKCPHCGRCTIERFTKTKRYFCGTCGRLYTYTSLKKLQKEKERRSDPAYQREQKIRRKLCAYCTEDWLKRSSHVCKHVWNGKYPIDFRLKVPCAMFVLKPKFIKHLDDRMWPYK